MRPVQPGYINCFRLMFETCPAGESGTGVSAEVLFQFLHHGGHVDYDPVGRAPRPFTGTLAPQGEGYLEGRFLGTPFGGCRPNSAAGGTWRCETRCWCPSAPKDATSQATPTSEIGTARRRHR